MRMARYTGCKIDIIGGLMFMQKIFFTADTHFGHENVIQFDKRPFSSASEMDEEMIKRWNNKVGKGDLVYVLGDMIWKSLTDYAEPLIKYLLEG